MNALYLVIGGLIGCGSEPITDPVPFQCDEAANDDGTATLCGEIRRSAEPANGGRGGVYVALFDADPVWNTDEADLIAWVLVDDQDMRDADAVVTYTMEAIPPSPAPWFMMAFLDDNDNAGTTSPAPDKGDLISFDLDGATGIVLDEAREYRVDVDLNMAMPF